MMQIHHMQNRKTSDAQALSIFRFGLQATSHLAVLAQSADAHAHAHALKACHQRPTGPRGHLLLAAARGPPLCPAKFQQCMKFRPVSMLLAMCCVGKHSHMRIEYLERQRMAYEMHVYMKPWMSYLAVASIRQILATDTTHKAGAL